MKKIIIILLAFLTFTSYGQAEYEKIAITENVETASTSKIVSQQPGTGELNYINATALPLSVEAVNALYLKENANQHKYLLGNFYNKIYAQKTGIASVKWLTFGDSYAQTIYKEIAPILQRMSGNNVSGAYFSGNTNGISNNATSGSVVDNTTDFQSWVTGLTTTFSGGATRTYGAIGGAIYTTKIKLYYVIEPGGGTFKFQVNGVDATGYTNVSTAGALGTLGVVTINQARTLCDWKVVNLTGTVKIIGTGYEDSTVSGLTTINVSQGGIPLNNAVSYASAMSNFNSFLADVQPTVFSFEMKEDSSYYATALNSFYTAINTNLASTDVINIGSTPIAVNDADQVIQNAQLETASAAFGHKYYDTYKIFKSYANLVSLGWNGDGTHVTAEANQYRGKLMLQDLGINSETEIMPNNIVNERINTKSINVLDTTGNIGTFDSFGNTQLTLKTQSTSNAVRFNMFSGFSGTYGNSFIEADQAELRLYASDIGGGNSKITFWRGGIKAMELVNGSGGYSTLRVSGGIDSPVLIGTPTAPTATAGTNNLEIANTAFVQNAIGNYKKYVALLTQTSTSDPTATVLENTLGGTLVWTRTGTGAYLATLSGVFSSNKTTVIVTPTSGSTIASASSSSVNDVNLSTALSTTAAAIDGVLTNATIEIRVYP